TAIKVMTDGILLAELQGDHLLSEYGVIVLDEAHERSLNIDFLLGYLRLLLQRRNDLKLVITSATIDTRLFAEAFGGAPVIEVSGRLYPVEVQYRPPAEDPEGGEESYTEAAARVVVELAERGGAGDVLVFMPGERDIRETCDLIEAETGDRLEVVPLYGRLSNEEQQRIFRPGPKRRVVVATNVAETSLTVPRIRYVVDTGLARISRYHPGTRSQRLPIEPIARSNADQRKGRCGRLSGGVCIRLYSEEDYLARRPFAEPEIQRCNLAAVVLRMKAWGLGDIETFPFLEPPPPRAIQGACALLRELGALDEEQRLTPLGRELARLPVDPAIGRMILEARAERCLREVLVIAAGLSIQDPRERPFDQRDAARAAHRRFDDPRSDFLTLLNIWNVYHDTWESLKTQSQLRKFCRQHFLSFLRMREWVDLHDQLEQTLRESDGFEPNREPADPAAIHRALLTGLFGHVARREERNVYRTVSGRLVHVFPGSALFDRGGGETAGEGRREKVVQPAWIVAGELVETSRPFARTLAGIDPNWVIELAPHLIRRRHVNVRFDPERGLVLSEEQIWLGALKLQERTINHHRVAPKEAEELFIRAGLVAEGVLPPEETEVDPGEGASRRRGWTVPPAVREVLERNRQLLAKIELWQTRLPARVAPDLEEALYRFYAGRLEGVASVRALTGWLRRHGGAAALCAKPADLLGDKAAAFEAGAFPDEIAYGKARLPVRYAYAPGEETDGVTVRLEAPLVELVDPAALEWAVPALREERVLALLQALPKSLRRPLVPLRRTARALVEAIPGDARDFLEQARRVLRERWGVFVTPEQWRAELLPAHLRPRFEVVAQNGRTLAAGRDWSAVREQVRRSAESGADALWRRACEQWERVDVAGWTFGDLPEQVAVGEWAGLPVTAWPG
ncbi:MAG: ATP-dependent RNA helicase HrpA, partial [Verrucomicrobia bacterium]